MGNDGGSIPKRRELVKEAARLPSTTELKEARAESQEHAWTHCALSSRPLAAPIVSDAVGKLYNKDSVLEFLLAEEGSAEKVEGEKILAGRVKGLKDVVEVKFSKDESDKEGKKEGAKWVCPVTRMEMGPRAQAVYVVPCGHAFAGSVVREVKDGVCVEVGFRLFPSPILALSSPISIHPLPTIHPSFPKPNPNHTQCSTPYAENDTIPILPTDPTTLACLTLRLKTLSEKGLTHALKKAPGSKKRKKPTTSTLETDVSDTKTPVSEDDGKNKDNGTTKPKPRRPDSSIQNASTAYLTKKVLAEQEERNKRRKVEENENVRSLFKKGGTQPDLRNSKDYMTRGFSIGGR